MKLDYSKFKKISSDDHSTTLQHGDGHMIRIAHKALSKQTKAELDKLPHFDDGGSVGDREPTSQPWDFSSNLMQYKPEPESFPSPLRENPHVQAQPEEAPKPVHHEEPKQAAKPKETIAPKAEAPVQAPPEIAQPPQPVAAPAQEPAPAAPQENPMAQPPAAENNPQDFKISPEHINQELSAEDQAWQHDLHNGHVTPETYKGLFGKQDTLGKVGTIFGLLVGGMGAGLTHGPNQYLEMMNKEIQNDLEAQKQSKGNAQNFIKLQNDHQLQLAQQQKMGFENAFTQAQTGKVGTEQKLTLAQIDQMQKQGQLTLAQAQEDKAKIPVHQAEAKNIQAEASIRADALAHMQSNRAAMDHLRQQILRYPEGSKQRQDAESAYAMLSQQVDLMNADISSKAAGAAAMAHTIYGNGQGQSSEQQYQQTQSRLPMMGPMGVERQKYNEEHHFPGFKGQSSDVLGPNDKEQFRSGVQFDKQLHDFMNWTKNHSGDLRPDQVLYGRTMADQLSTAYRDAINGGIYKKGEQEFLNRAVDEEPTKFFNRIRVLPKLQALAYVHRKKMENLAKSHGYEGYEAPTDQPESRMYNGAQYQKVNGGWQKVK